MSRPIYQVDAFAAAPFTGNPAAVCPLDGPADEEWMQRVAMEMNLPETAFLWPVGKGYDLRWFTPACEVELCGHATLAAAHVLWTEGLSDAPEVAFYTRSGTLTARREGERVVLDFPAEPPHGTEAPAGLDAALGANPVWVGRNRMDLFVELRNAKTVRELRPDLARVARLDVRGVIVSARSDTEDADYVCRFFAPQSGIDEDPVTGSAHCALGPYWEERLGRRELTGFQCSPRGGTVGVRMHGDRVELIGQAVTVLRGELNVAPL